LLVHFIMQKLSKSKAAGRRPAVRTATNENEVAIVAKYLCACRVGLGAQAGMPVILNFLEAGMRVLRVCSWRCGEHYNTHAGFRPCAPNLLNRPAHHASVTEKL
jgi:hypothetical protein